MEIQLQAVDCEALHEKYKCRRTRVLQAAGCSETCCVHDHNTVYYQNRATRHTCRCPCGLRSITISINPSFTPLHTVLHSNLNSSRAQCTPHQHTCTRLRICTMRSHCALHLMATRPMWCHDSKPQANSQFTSQDSPRHLHPWLTTGPIGTACYSHKSTSAPDLPSQNQPSWCRQHARSFPAQTHSNKLAVCCVCKHTHGQLGTAPTQPACTLSAHYTADESTAPHHKHHPGSNIIPYKH